MNWQQTRPGFWEVGTASRYGTVWEVAARPNLYQWTVYDRRSLTVLAGGTEDTLTEHLTEAQASAESHLEPNGELR